MSKQHTTAAIICAAIILLVLAVMPAQAQDIGGATSSSLYLPSIERNFALWFTDQELSDAMWRTGYNPDVAGQHTVCYLDPSSVLPDDLRWSSCEQYYVDGVATEGTGHMIWYVRLGDGIVHGLEVGGTMVQSAGTDAPCYVDGDGEVSCG